MPVLMPAIKLNKKVLFFLFIFLVLAVYGLVSFLSQGDEKSKEVLSMALAGRTIIIDPGHGGRDPGISEGEAIEKEITLQVARKLQTILSQAGATAILTREKDVLLKSSEDKNFSTKKAEDQYTRVNIANKQNADILVSLHVNSYRADTRQHGAQTFSYSKSEKGTLLAQYIQEEIVRILGYNRRKAKDLDDKYILNQADMPAVIVEMGFLTNPRENKLLQNPDYQGKMAYAICSGIAKYFETQASESTGEKNRPEPQEVFSEPYNMEAP